MEYDELMEWLESCPTHKWEVTTVEDDFAVVIFQVSSYEHIKEIEILDDDDDYPELLFDEYD